MALRQARRQAAGQAARSRLRFAAQQLGRAAGVAALLGASQQRRQIARHQEVAASRIQSAFAGKRQRERQAAEAAEAAAAAEAEAMAALPRASRTPLARFRAAARASLAFAAAPPPAPSASAASAAADLVDDTFEGAVLHAGHLVLSATGGGSPSRARQEYYCVLLSTRCLLCLPRAADGAADGADSADGGGLLDGSFDASSGEARRALPLRLHEVSVEVRAVHTAPGAKPEVFELTCDGRTWLAEPAALALGHEALASARARAVRVWVRRLCAVIASEATRGSRATLGGSAYRATLGAARGLEDDDDDDELAQPEKPLCHLAGQWKDGCFYEGDGSVAYYTGKCVDDPYA